MSESKKVEAVPVPLARAPSVAEARASRLFSPIDLGPLRLETRTWVPAMVPWRATDDGFVTDDVLDWYGRFADGRPGAIVLEATGIRDVPSGPLLRIGQERFVEGLTRVVDVVHQRSRGETKVLVQLIDFLAIRRRPQREKFLRRFLELSTALRARLAMHTGEADLEQASDEAVRERLVALDDAALVHVLDKRQFEDLAMGYRERVTDLDLPHVRELPQVLPGLFADAAERARRAGFDGVELHYAHAYTMASFLSAHNNRTDGYGGSRAERVRLPLEVFAAVRARVGVDYCVGCRFLGDEVVDGGGRREDAAHYAAAFADAGMDFLSVSKGGKFEDARQPKVGEAAYPYTGPSGHECMPTVRIGGAGPFGRNLGLARAVREAVHTRGHTTPVIGAGGIHSFDLAEAALARGDCDVIASARQSLADPDWFQKVRAGRGAAVRTCKFTNYCEALDQRHLEVTCQLWDKDLDSLGVDGAAPRTSRDGKRRLVPPPYSPNTSASPRDQA